MARGPRGLAHCTGFVTETFWMVRGSQMGPLGALPELQSMPKVAWSGGVRETPPGEGGQEALSLCRPGPSSSLVRRQGLV